MQLRVQHIQVMPQTIPRIIQRPAEMTVGVVVNQANGDLGDLQTGSGNTRPF